MADKMSEEQIYGEAKKRVEEKRRFRTHAIVYAVINAFLVLIWWLTGAGFPWFVFPLGGWGIGLLFHGLGVYVLSGRQEDRRAIGREAEKIRRSESRYPVEEGEKAQQEELDEGEEEAKREKEEEEEEAKREKEEEEGYLSSTCFASSAASEERASFFMVASVGIPLSSQPRLS